MIARLSRISSVLGVTGRVQFILISWYCCHHIHGPSPITPPFLLLVRELNVVGRIMSGIGGWVPRFDLTFASTDRNGSYETFQAISEYSKLL